MFVADEEVFVADEEVLVFMSIHNEKHALVPMQEIHLSAILVPVQLASTCQFKCYRHLNWSLPRCLTAWLSRGRSSMLSLFIRLHG